MERFSRTERIWIAAVLLLGCCLVVKSLWLDPYRPSNDEEQRWLAVAEASLAKETPTFLERSGIVLARVVAIRSAAGDGGKDILKATVRRYVLQVLPFGDEVRKLDPPQ